MDWIQLELVLREIVLRIQTRTFHTLSIVYIVVSVYLCVYEDRGVLINTKTILKRKS